MSEETDVQLHGRAGDLAFIFALNIVIDALVTYRPEFEGEIATRINSKIKECKETGGLEQVAPALGVVLAALQKSGRALQRTPPAGQA